MSAESYQNIYQKPESYFGSYEEEYRILGHIGTIRLMQGIAQSPHIRPPVIKDKSVPAHIYRLCQRINKKPFDTERIAHGSIEKPATHNDRVLALINLGILNEPVSKPTINQEFILALNLEFAEDEFNDEVRKDSDIQRHYSALDFYVTHYLNKIEDEVKSNGTNTFRNFSTLSDCIRDIEFYIGHEDPRMLQG